MKHTINKENLKKIIIEDKYLNHIFRQSKYMCNFSDDDWWLFHKGLFVSYFDGIEKLCKKKPLIVSNCKQETKGYRYLIKVSDDTLTTSITECACNYAEKLEPFYYYYDFPRENLNLNIENSNFFFKKNRENCLNYISKILIPNIKNDQKNRGIYLYSKNKTGKTFMFNILSNKIAELKQSVLFISMSNLIYKWQIIHNKNSVDYINNKDFHKLCLETDFLFIDSIGSGYMNNWMRDNILFHILEHRLKHSMPIFFTSNLSLSELKEWFLNNSNNKKFYTKTNNNSSEIQIDKLIKLIKDSSNIFSWN